MDNSWIKKNSVKVIAALGMVLGLYSSTAIATVTFEGDDGVKQILEVTGGCTGCHGTYDATPAVACTGNEDLDLVSPYWYPSFSGTDTDKYNAANNCRATIQKHVNFSVYVNPAASTDPYVYMPASSACDPFNEDAYGVVAGADTSGCLTVADKNIVTGWGGTRWAAPTVTTSASSGSSNQGGTFNGSVLINGAVLSAGYFKYSTSAATVTGGGGTTISDLSLPTSAGGGTTAYTISRAITGLSCATTYYYRAYATNALGTGNGANNTLLTSACTDPTITEGATLSRPSETEDIPDTFTLNATDPDVGTLTWSISDNTSLNGEAAVDAPVTGLSTGITYTPTLNYVGTDSFVVKVTDEADGFDEITVNVTIANASDPPTITEETVEGTPIAVAMSEDSSPTPFALTLTGEDPDAGTTLYWSIDTPASSGTASVTGTTVPGGSKSVTYTPNANVSGTIADSFVVGVYDAGVQSGNFDRITINVNIAASNDPPVAVDDSVATDPAFEVLVNSSNNNLDVLANDTDVDTAYEGDTKKIISIGAANGAASISANVVNNTIIYTPVTDDFVGESFTYTMQDTAGVTSMATVTVSFPDGDGDGVIDYLDNCAATSNATQADFDGDGVPYQTDNAATDPAATDGNGFVVGGDACDGDSDADGIPDIIEDDLAFPFLNSLDPTDAGLDFDGDGLTNLQEYNSDPTGASMKLDSVAPVVTAPADVAVNATGFLTMVNLGTAIANDGNDGKINSIAGVVNVDVLATDWDGSTVVDAVDLENFCKVQFSKYLELPPFRPGAHTVTWVACDKAGNFSSAVQNVTVVPLLNTTASQTTGEGRAINVDVMLNGPAAAYPVTVDYAVTGRATVVDDYDPLGTTISITDPDIDGNTPGIVGRLAINILADAITDPGEDIVLTLSSPVNAVLDVTTVHTVFVTETNVAPLVELGVTQGGKAAGANVYVGGGAVSIITTVDEPNGDAVTYDWSMSDGVLTAAVPVTNSSLDFAVPAAGLYPVEVNVSDGASTTTTTMLLHVAAVPDPADCNLDGVADINTDCDGDGATNVAEDVLDSDGDGIADYLDSNTYPLNILQNQSGDVASSYLLETEPGLAITLGTTALASGVAGALVDQSGITTYGGQNAAAGLLPEDTYTNVGGFYDFEISGLNDTIDTATVVIPLQSAILPDAVYRKYDGNGWFMFVEDARNSVKSAPGEQGVCPAPGSSAYTAGLTVFYSCVQLTIQDGGPNDIDGVRDNVIRDPGGVAIPPDAAAVAASSKGRIGVMHPLVLLGMLGIIVLLYRSHLYLAWYRRFTAALVKKQTEK